MIFEQWLKKQVKRQDPVGDLARDFRDSKKIKCVKGEECDEAHLSKWGAHQKVYNALTIARKEWRTECEQL